MIETMFGIAWLGIAGMGYFTVKIWRV